MRRRRAIRRRRNVMVAVIAAALAVIATAARGDTKPPPGSVTMPQNPKTMHQIPGGPIVVKKPDLIVEKIEVSFSQNVCNGYHAGIMPVTVTVKNVGFARAVMTTWNPWIHVWSTIGDLGWAQYVGDNVLQLAPGGAKSYTVKLQVMAYIAPGNKSGSIGIEAAADPNGAMAELNEDNNSKHVDIGLGYEYCPSGQ